MQIPCINPDGLDMVVALVSLATSARPTNSPRLPRLYQKYAGHDNNRDYFMLNLAETRNVTALLFQQWFPQIVYNQHQAPPVSRAHLRPALRRAAEPQHPRARHGRHQPDRRGHEGALRACTNKPGVLSYWGFDAWWNGGLRSVPAFHNMHGILTETAGYRYGNPKNYRPPNSPNVSATAAHQGAHRLLRAPLDGRQMGRSRCHRLHADRRFRHPRPRLDARAALPLQSLGDRSRQHRGAAGNGKPYAYIIPRDQADRMSTKALAWRLQYAGIRVERASAGFHAMAGSTPKAPL